MFLSYLQMPKIKGSRAIVWHTIVKSLTILKILTFRFVSIEGQLIDKSLAHLWAFGLVFRLSTYHHCREIYVHWKLTLQFKERVKIEGRESLSTSWLNWNVLRGILYLFHRMARKKLNQVLDILHLREVSQLRASLMSAWSVHW